MEWTKLAGSIRSTRAYPIDPKLVTSPLPMRSPGRMFIPVDDDDVGGHEEEALHAQNLR
jgi:hypothetical protein